ncbi:52 kDa repressor of the inhibitor of the protein kinase-like [Dendronephthya gigantea]|uniref:52 kDa repressor of the inhibitor of the protein kinase-like n=1 Tax=Dendronephthya gigantea TaxID=151771 RepID=UPI00106ABD46|nr:52 kDa repressor of the inhibitor of the protein kinase-like [Dendronephthya gigantea]
MLSEAHKAAEEMVYYFLSTRQPGTDIAAKLSKQISEQQVRSKMGLLSIIDTIIRLGMRGIALRGNWIKKRGEENGNLIFFLNWKSEFDKTLKDHLQYSPRNAKFTSPRIQNEIISICESIIREKIIAKIQTYWSLMADETTDVSSTEQMSICIRFVNSKLEVCEEFLGFVKLTKMDAQSVYDVLIPTLEGWGLDLTALVGQGYDGASVMSGSKNGLHKKVTDHYPNAVYRLQPTGVDDELTALLTEADEEDENKEDEDENDKENQGQVNDEESSNDEEQKSDEDGSSIQDHGFNKSKKAILRGTKTKTVPKLCPTRWSSRVETLSALLAKYSSVLKTLEQIADQSNGEPRGNANAYIRLMESPQFIVALVVVQSILGFTAEVTKILQAKECNLGEAYAEVNRAKECIRTARADDSWNKVWERIQTVGNAVEVEITKPRTARNQRHRANSGNANQTCEDYYRINVYYPFIDRVVEEIETRFAFEHKGLLAAQTLVPVYLKTLTVAKLDDIKEFFGKFLTFTQLSGFDTEIVRWKQKFVDVPLKEKPKNACDAITKCDAAFYPAISKILTIFLTVPVGSVCCERSFSALRRLKLWTRASMGEERLSGLAMLMINQDSSNIPTADDVYARKAKWRI